MSNYQQHSATYRVIGKITSIIIGIVAAFIVGIVIACVVKHTTFTVEWANMIAWFATWAK
ncbi:MAG: hypothetical protein RR338_00245 [Clostridia bacterium]